MLHLHKLEFNVVINFLLVFLWEVCRLKEGLVDLMWKLVNLFHLICKENVSRKNFASQKTFSRLCSSFALLEDFPT